jgi:hypothetical protein
MLNNKTLTIEVRISDPIGRPFWPLWEEYGKVSAVRLPDRTPVATTDTVFDPHIAVPDDSIRILNGWGSVSFTLDQGAAFAPGDIEVSVSWSGLSASKVVTVLANPTFRNMSGNLTGANLVWGPDENIRVTGNCTVPAGSTLTIKPGTIVQVDTTGSLENGTLITVNGNLQAMGSRASPIHFFSERGPAAMKLTQAGSASNADAWRGLQFYGSGSSTMRYVFLTGAGNGNVVSHPRPPILGMFNTHSLTTEYCVFADDDGMVFSGQGTGTYTVRKTLVSRVGIGGEFFGNGHTLLLKDSWWMSIGRAPESENLDGDLMHVDGANSKQLIRGCILQDGGDDGIDHSESSFTVEHTILSHIRDKTISMTGGHVNVFNLLSFDTAIGIRGVAAVDHVTLAVPSPIMTVESAQRSIIWPASISTCTGDVDYTDVGSAADLGCGNGNISTDPQFTDVARSDYNPRPGSPALTAGPDGERIGWLGFPYGATCKVTADCNDTNACTTDTCVSKLCVFTPIVGCIPCETEADCDDGNACTVDVCQADYKCSNAPVANGTACDDGKSCTSPDTCTAGVCAGPQSCPAGMHCEPYGSCVTDTLTITFQQDVNGYTGTHDTYLHQGQPDTVEGALATWRWDMTDPDTSTNQEFGLLRFASIFGSAAGQIPTGSTIFSATLTLNVEDLSDVPAGSINAAAVTWDEATATWNNFGGDAGVQADEYGAYAGAAPIAVGTFAVDVTSSVRAWLAAPASNYGWIFRPASVDGLVVTSSEGTTVANRPKLTVSYAPPVASCTTDANCTDGQFCDGTETCNQATHVCQPGAAPNCDDGVACTADSCNETTDQCVHVASNVFCDDGNLCTDDTCSATLGCQHANNTVPCDDGNACTTGDACKAGACASGPATVCDDGVACTADSCDPATGCAHADTCSVGNVCNLATGSCEKGPTTVTFQQGVAGYTGTVDTYVSAGAPDTSNATVTPLVVDGNVPPEEERQILLRFDAVFGTGQGQVPPGARIVSATLTMYVTNPSPDGASLHRILVPWADTDTWTSTGGGMKLDGHEALAASDASGATNSNKVPYDMDVKASLIAWSGGATNLGWVFVAPAGATDSWQLASSENDDPDTQPKLTVKFLPCDPGYKGDGVACFDIDECQDVPGACDANATCANTVGSYTCTCKTGYQGDGHACSDVDECKASPGPCDQNATCTNTVGAYVCACDSGYTGDGHACADVNECDTTPDPCGPEAYCVNTVGSYTCECNPGYEVVGASCKDIDECVDSPGPCSPYAKCTNLPGAYACACNPGFTGNGKTCTDVDECKAVPGPCNANASCVNLAGSYACSCNAGYTGDGKLCGECPGGAATPCSGHGTCGGSASAPICGCDAGFGGAACADCLAGHYGPACATECPGGSAQPCTDHGTCSDGIAGTGACSCFTGFAGNACDACASGFFDYPDCSNCPDCSDGNPCTTDSCDLTAGCQHANNTLPCDDKDECTEGDTCAGGSCHGVAKDCDDNDACTTDSCDETAGCTHEPLAGCCSSDGQCQPPGKCLLRPCDSVTHSCGVFESISGCCTSDEDCDDGREATTDTCDQGTGTCVLEGACTDVTDCYDPDPCTTDKCDIETGLCVHAPIEGCCGGPDSICSEEVSCPDDACGGEDAVLPEDGAVADVVQELAADTPADAAEAADAPVADVEDATQPGQEVVAGDGAGQDVTAPGGGGGCASGSGSGPAAVLLMLLALARSLRRRPL